MGDNGAVRRGVGDAGEDEASLELVVVKEALLRVVHLAGGDLAGAGRARARAARVGEVHARLLRHVKDVLVLGALDGLSGERKQTGNMCVIWGVNLSYRGQTQSAELQTIFECE